MLAAFAFFLVVLADTGRIPVETRSGTLELKMIHEGSVLEHSGGPLALMKWGSAMKQLILYTILVGCIFAVIDNSFSKLCLFKIAELLAAAFLLAALSLILEVVVVPISTHSCSRSDRVPPSRARVAPRIQARPHYEHRAVEAPFAYARPAPHKERATRLRARLCGSRFGRGVVVPGGVSEPPPIGDSELLVALERDVRADIAPLTATPSYLDRRRRTGTLSSRIAAARGARGRGSGLREDVRTSRPYGGYRDLGSSPATREDGDALSRQLVRNDEIVTSFHLVRQTVDELESLGDPAARWSTRVEPVSGEGFAWAKAPQGEVLYFVKLDEGMPVQVGPRSASTTSRRSS